MGLLLSHPSDIGPVQLAECGEFDISEMYYAESGRIYYINLPKKYFKTMMMRMSLANFILCATCYRYNILWLIPVFITLGFKINIFVNWCQTINLSRRKLWTFFAIEWMIFQIAGLFLRMLVVRLLN